MTVCKKAAELAQMLNRIKAKGVRLTADKILQKASCEEICWYYRELVEKEREHK